MGSYMKYVLDYLLIICQYKLSACGLRLHCSAEAVYQPRVKRVKPTRVEHPVLLMYVGALAQPTALHAESTATSRMRL